MAIAANISNGADGSGTGVMMAPIWVVSEAQFMNNQPTTMTSAPVHSFGGDFNHFLTASCLSFHFCRRASLVFASGGCHAGWCRSTASSSQLGGSSGLIPTPVSR